MPKPPNRLKHVRALALLAAVSVTPLAHAQQRGYAINQLEVSERGSEWFATDSLDLRGHVRPALGVVGEWAFRPLIVNDANGDFARAIVRNQFVLHPGGSLVLWDRLRLGVDLPVQAYANGRSVVIGDTSFAAPADKTSLGDLRLSATLRLFGSYGEHVTGAFALRVELPTGAPASYAGDGDVRIAPQLLVAGDIAVLTYAAVGGVTLRTSGGEHFASTTLGPSADLALSAGLRVLKRRLVIGPEFFAHSVLTHDQFFKRRTTSMEGLIGAHFMVIDGLRVGAGIGAGLTSGYGTPNRRGLLSVEWVPVIEPAPAPPPAPPPDRDHDTVLDANDACPDVPGLPSADPSANGCPPPPPDRDHDGVLDANDACPDEPGEASDDPARNGCPPPPDRDHDGVLDANDACPDEPGEASSDPARNGCPPPPDRDHDGVLDASDACPDEPGDADPDPKRNGCPKAFVQGDQIRILDQVKFKTNSAQILPGQDSEDVLQAVLRVLAQHPEVNKLRIEGHTDNRGGINLNRKLSQNRAQSVVDWLIKHGIAAERLSSSGLGPDRPIDTNATEEGRRNNRRVEFHILPSAAVPPAPPAP